MRVVRLCISLDRMLGSSSLLVAASLWGATAVAQMTAASEQAVVVPMREASPNAASSADPISTAASISRSRKRAANGHAIFMPKRGASPTVAATTNPLNMTYYGGLVIPHPTVYAFWWGIPSDFPHDTQDGIDDFFHALDGSAYMELPDQYLFGKDAYIRFGGNLFDYSAPPLEPVDLTTGYFSLAPEVCKVLQANGQKPDPNGIYAIYASNFPNQPLYCAFHGYDTCPDGTVLQIVYVPNATTEPLCWVQPPELSCNNHSNGMQAAANSTAHELMETMTDPYGDGWTNAATGAEIADPCDFTFKRCVHLSDGSKLQLQEIWSNKVGACAQGSGVIQDD
jgi:hypothetical protein